MEYLPIFVALDRRPVLVVGGGGVALRKVRLLLEAGAAVTVVSPALCDDLLELHETGSIQWYERQFDDSDLDSAWLVYTATDNPALQERVAREAERRRVLVNTVDDQAQCSFIMPAIVDRSPVMVAISTGGASPVLARRIREAVEQALPRATAALARFTAQVRTRIAERLPDFTRRRRFHEWLVDGPVGEAVRNGRHSEAEERLEKALNTGNLTARGHVTLVGAGPGDPELLTLRALNALQAADVVVHDGLVDPGVLERARRDAEFINVAKRAGHHRLPQAQMNELLVALAEEGKTVVRLKGGDPFVFGRGGEEIAHLRAHGIPYAVVPGITAAVGCAAYAGIPLTHRDHAHSVWLVTAHCRDSVDTLDWHDLAHSHQTLAIYMGVRQVGRVRERLIRHGRDPSTPVAFVENGCRSNQRVIVGTLDTMEAMATTHALQSPALIYVGEVAGLGATLNWFGEAPIQAEPEQEKIRMAG